MTTRRTILKTMASAAALSVWDAPFRFSFASVPTERRLVVVVIRGALDGLAAVPPHGDPDYASILVWANFGSALAGAASYGFRSPCDPGEQLPVRMFQADEVVAAVAGRPEHHPVARFAQGFDRLHQKSRGQRRAVTVDEQDTVVSGIEQAKRRAKQHMAEIVAGLQQKPEIGRKQLAHDLLGPRRRVDAIAATAKTLRNRVDRGRHVTEKAGRQL